MHLPLQIVARHAQLYRDCLRLADYISNRGSQASRGSLRAQVRDAFRKHQGETDPVEIEKQKDAAIRGLSNYMFYEAQRMAKEGEEGGEVGHGFTHFWRSASMASASA